MPHERSSSRARALLLVALIAVITAGCTPADPAPTPAPTPDSSPVPSPSASPARASVPTPFLDVACSDLLTEERLYSVLGATAAQRRPQWIELGSETGPVRPAIRHLGGIECEWANDRPWVHGGANLGYEGVNVRVLPEGTDAWEAYTSYYGTTTTEEAWCSALDGRRDCIFNELVDDRWVQATVIGSTIGGGGVEPDVELVRPLFDDVLAALAVAEPAEERWSPPSDTVALADGCDGIITADQAAEVLGLPEGVVLDGTDGGSSLAYRAWVAAGSVHCPWAQPGGLIGAGITHSWLPGGEWAWDEELASASPRAFGPLAIAGLAPGDSAYLRCPDPTLDCTVDLVIGRNWIRFQAYRDDYVERPLVDKVEKLTRLAELAVANVRG